jgi:hypothetical protein
MTAGKVGHGECPRKACGKPAYFSRSAGGKLKYECRYCDSSGYAEPGGIGERADLESVARNNAPEPEKSTTKPATKKDSGLLIA